MGNMLFGISAIWYRWLPLPPGGIKAGFTVPASVWQGREAPPKELKLLQLFKEEGEYSKGEGDTPWRIQEHPYISLMLQMFRD